MFNNKVYKFSHYNVRDFGLKPNKPTDVVRVRNTLAPQFYLELFKDDVYPDFILLDMANAYFS